jgi:hypothetical protein
MTLRSKSTFLSSEMPLFLLLLLIGLALGYFLTISSPSLRFAALQPQAQLQEQAPKQPIEISVVNQGGDDRYSRPPRPQRFWDNGPEYPPRGALLPPDGGRLINMHTQGLPESYQSMGLLKTEEGQMLPLYGRRVATRSDRYNYYTRTDTYNPLPLPIRYKRRDCQDDVGCEELFNGDEVLVTPTGNKATATLYQFDGPTYIPAIV